MLQLLLLEEEVLFLVLMEDDDEEEERHPSSSSALTLGRKGLSSKYLSHSLMALQSKGSGSASG